MGQRILIIGGGFGGFYTAKKLERLAPADANIMLVNDVNFMLYAPLLPGAAAGTIDPRHIVVPLREHLKRTELRMGYVTGGDPARKVINVNLIAGNSVEVEYDQLVVALGSVARTFPIPGLIEHAVGFKTIVEATALRNRIVRHLEMAEAIDDIASRKAYLTFIFVGGGYAGLEGIAELADFASDAIKHYPRCKEAGAQFILVDIAERIMLENPQQLAEFTVKVLEKRGIKFFLKTSVEEVREDQVTLSDGQVIPCRTVVWTAGVKASPVAADLGLPLDRGRIKVDATMRVEGFDNVWALGDVAAVPDPARPGFPCPPTAQHAIRQGKLLAKNIVASMTGQTVKPFTYKTLGSFADLGRHTATAKMMNVRIKGFLAWVIARSYHLAWLPGLDRKSRLIADWSVELLFPRDLAELGQLGHPPALGELAPPPLPGEEARKEAAEQAAQDPAEAVSPNPS